MRRLIALLSLLLLANLTFVRGGAACPLTGHHAEQPVGAAMAGHEGHDMGAMASHDMTQQAPREHGSHAPACLAMGPCAVAIDVTSAVTPAAVTTSAGPVLGSSDHLPPSAIIAPELPPPRA